MSRARGCAGSGGGLAAFAKGTASRGKLSSLICVGGGPAGAGLRHPIRLALFVKGGDAFPGLSRFAGFHLILECNIEHLLLLTPPTLATYSPLFPPPPPATLLGIPF